MHDATNELADEIAKLVIQRLSSEPIMPRVWFDHREAAEYTRRSTRSLDQAIAEGHGPKVNRGSGGKRVYHVKDLDAWLRG